MRRSLVADFIDLAKRSIQSIDSLRNRLVQPAFYQVKHNSG